MKSQASWTRWSRCPHRGLEQRRKAEFIDLSRRTGSYGRCISLVLLRLNISPTFAAAACDLPVVGDCVRYSCFGNCHKEGDIKYIDAKIPQIKSTGKTELEQRINQEIRGGLRLPCCQ